jgi:hypothetical protein
MAKVKPKTLDQELSNVYDYEWEDYIWAMEQNSWVDWDEHPWEWYMEKMKLLGQGWHSVMINPIHKNVTVIHWLKSQKAVFKYSRNEFLIKEEKDAIMVALKFA